MLNKIKKFLGMTHEIDSKEVRRLFSSLDYWGDVNTYTYYITSFRVFQKKEGITIDLRLHRPGYFIGAKGSNIALIRKHMSSSLNQKVEINLIEEDMFSTCYR